MICSNSNQIIDRFPWDIDVVVMVNSDLSSQARILYFHYLSLKRLKASHSPTNEELAYELNDKVSNIVRHKRELTKAGLLLLVRQKGTRNDYITYLGDSETSAQTLRERHESTEG